MKNAPGAHPHFRDGGAFTWHPTLASAIAAAKASGKKILIEYGREACGNCRDLVENVLTREEVKRAVDAGFVLAAIDCDAPDPAVRALGAANMSHAHVLPFVIYTDADGKFLHGTQGARSARDVLADLELVAKKG